MADVCGIHPKAWTNYELGDTHINVFRLGKLCSKIGTSVGQVSRHIDEVVKKLEERGVTVVYETNDNPVLNKKLLKEQDLNRLMYPQFWE